MKIQTVETFDFNYIAATKKIKNRYLKLLEADCTEQGLSALFVGTAGPGKTHLARAPGDSLCTPKQRLET